MDTPVIDQTKLESLVMRAVGDLSSAYGGVMVSVGSKLGLYKAMAGAGPLSSKELAARAGCAERYVREWLSAQAAGGYVGYHAVSDTYELSPEQAMVLADEDSPVFIPPAWQVPASMWFDEEKTIEAFRTGKGVAWGDHDGRLQRPRREQPLAGRAALLRSLDHDLLCARNLGGRHARPRRAGRRGAPGRSVPQGRVHALSARGRDTLQPDSRSAPLTSARSGRPPDPGSARAIPCSAGAAAGRRRCT